MDLGGWLAISFGNRPTQIMPMADLRPHEAVAPCWCRPELDDTGDALIHHSMDGREAYENGSRRLH